MFVQSHGRVTQFSERRLANRNEARECEIERRSVTLTRFQGDAIARAAPLLPFKTPGMDHTVACESGISTVIHAACGHSLVDGNGNGSRAGSPRGSHGTGSTQCAEPRIAVWHDLLRETCKGDIT